MTINDFKSANEIASIYVQAEKERIFKDNEPLLRNMMNVISDEAYKGHRYVSVIYEFINEGCAANIIWFLAQYDYRATYYVAHYHANNTMDIKFEIRW